MQARRRMGGLAPSAGRSPRSPGSQCIPRIIRRAQTVAAVQPAGPVPQTLNSDAGAVHGAATEPGVPDAARGGEQRVAGPGLRLLFGATAPVAATPRRLAPRHIGISPSSCAGFTATTLQQLACKSSALPCTSSARRSCGRAMPRPALRCHPRGRQQQQQQLRRLWPQPH